MSTHMQGFQLILLVLHHFIFAKLASSIIRDKHFMLVTSLADVSERIIVHVTLQYRRVT